MHRKGTLLLDMKSLFAQFMSKSVLIDFFEKTIAKNIGNIICTANYRCG